MGFDFAMHWLATNCSGKPTSSSQLWTKFTNELLFQSVPYLWSLTLLCLPHTWSSIKSLKTSSVSQGEFQGIISTRHDQLLSVILSPRLPRRKEWYVAPRKHMPSVMVCMHRYINNFPTTTFCPTLIKLISQDVGLA